ncbi:hypothetical protein NLX83_15565 [Allokutzneria sp. A3M-2-11 16]|uniref:hypothetical protein n=1 Tax=Allokutzneria sp. A3M-2-11 16 TaxID=2962043 RepID=UPI0020B65EC9|nr:hypothetical protein [Allokutzneria sp. A3M-2-11 16]MCP3800685.1 hypothetical protein [Allokutzneria sp. A3M-2-11 16]
MDKLITPYTRMTGNHNHGWRPELTPVWVQLDALVRLPPRFRRRTVGHGLNMAGRVEGTLTGWFQTVDGLWLGVCHFRIPYADGRADTVAVRKQLVPEYALNPRANNASAAP